MEGLFFLAIIILGAVLVMPIIAIVTARMASQRTKELGQKVAVLQQEQRQLLQRLQQLEQEPPLRIQPEPERKPAAHSASSPAPAPSTRPAPVSAAQETPQSAPLPPPCNLMPVQAPVAKQTKFTPMPFEKPAESMPLRKQDVAKPRSRAQAHTLEQFMGAKLFAWVGGLALFLGIIFFVKLSIERGWISPELRTAIGFITGAGLVWGGLALQKQRTYLTLAHTLCAAGVVILYGVTFAAHAMWRIPPLDSAVVTFVVMALITTAAFLLAVQMNAQVVAILGMLGGFLTPVLCSTGEDQPGGLFTYMALLDVGVLAVAKNKRWLHLSALAAVGTGLLQVGWLVKFFHTSEYAVGSATWVPISVFLGFALLFTLAARWMRSVDALNLYATKSAVGLCLSALVAALAFLSFGSITTRPTLLYAFVLGINVVTMLAVWREPRMQRSYRWTVTVSFLHLCLWSMQWLKVELLPQALGIYLVFGLLNTAFCFLREPHEGVETYGRSKASLLPVALMALSLTSLDHMSFWVWPAMLLSNLLIMAVAALTGVLMPVLAALVLSLGAAAIWLLRWPEMLRHDLFPFLGVVGATAFLFSAAGCFLAKKQPKVALAVLLPIQAATLPFLLLILSTLMVPLVDPSPVFGLAALLVLFLLGLVRVVGNTELAPTALGCTLALQWVWQSQHLTAAHAVTPLVWHLAFYAVFTAFPFVFRQRFATATLPWVTSVVAGVGTFSLVFDLVNRTWPNDLMGLLPAAFAVAPLLSLMWVLKKHVSNHPALLDQIAWLAGTGLLFTTLIFPIQFEKEWITVGWALEGAALCWLLRRVPHPGLQASGAGLLLVAFIRLALNPAVLHYHLRGETAFLNWQLYAYSTTALALFCAAKWLSPASEMWRLVNLRHLFSCLGGVLLFLLMNLEIADAFTPVGSRSILFDFSGNLARDMTYSLAWGVFALVLLVLGFWKQLKATRYAGLGLLGVTLLKLFLHDLANIDHGYRIGALMGVAVIALLASFLYQRFLTEETQ